MFADPYAGAFLASINRKEEVICPGCGNKWTVEFREELGGCWPVNDNDLICAGQSPLGRGAEGNC